MQTTHQEMGSSFADREIVSSRRFAAPPRKVFRAWTNPERLSQWWGQVVLLEIAEPERVVLHRLSAPHFRLTATFVDDAGATRLTCRMRFHDAGTSERVRSVVLEVSELNLDRLSALLAGTAS